MSRRDSRHCSRLLGLGWRFLPLFCEDSSDYVTFIASSPTCNTLLLNCFRKRNKQGWEKNQWRVHISFNGFLSPGFSESVYIHVKGPCWGSYCGICKQYYPPLLGVLQVLRGLLSSDCCAMKVCSLWTIAYDPLVIFGSGVSLFGEGPNLYIVALSRTGLSVLRVNQVHFPFEGALCMTKNEKWKRMGGYPQCIDTIYTHVCGFKIIILVKPPCNRLEYV